jgi:hypothetical protein
MCRAGFAGSFLHYPVLAVFAAEPVDAGYQQAAEREAQGYIRVCRYTQQVEDGEGNEREEEGCCQVPDVLSLKTPELERSVDTLIDGIFFWVHGLCDYRPKKN